MTTADLEGLLRGEVSTLVLEYSPQQKPPADSFGTEVTKPASTHQAVTRFLA